MTLNQLRYFRCLAQTENYSTAARLLYISQPSLSRAIALLQEELGVSLFEKHGRNVVLTQAGKDFRRYTENALEQIDCGISAMQAYAQQTERISIGCVIPAISTYLVSMLAAFKEQTGLSPSYEVDSNQTEILIDGLKKGQYDLVFGSRVPEIMDVEFVPVSEMRFMLIMRRDDPLASMAEITPEQLKAANRPLLFTSAPSYSGLLRRMLAYYGITPFVGGIANEDNALLGMVEAGSGIFIGTDYPQMHTENIALVPFKQKRFHRYIYMAYSTERVYTPSVQALIEFNRRHALSEEEEKE
jgi:DNA-binding transcriptional LysR family regulator